MNCKIEVIYSSVASGIGEFFQLSIFHCLYLPLFVLSVNYLSKAITPVNSR